MNKRQGFIKSLKIIRNTTNEKSLNDHYVSVEWDSIPMLSVITGKNGIGKSTLMKMIVYYFNRRAGNYNVDKLNYKFELRDGINEKEIMISLIHFDDNVMDLRENSFISDHYDFDRKNPRKHIEFNFGEEIKNQKIIDLDWIHATSINRTFNTPDEEKLIKELQNEFGIKNFNFEF
jgi:ABC-type phosphate/phosphonate transport system ATPase subunit